MVSDRLRHYRLSIGVLIGCLVATGAVTFQLERAISLKDEERFDNAVNRLQDALSERLAMYVAMLRAGAAHVDTQGTLDLDGLRTFVTRLEVQQRYPGIQGVGFSARIAPGELAALVASRRAAGDAAFRVWPEQPRDEYHAILFLEPLDLRNRAAIGYDMFTDPTRRQAMARARDTAQPAASGPVELVQEIDEHKQQGFLIYMPVYAGGVVPETVEARRERLLGFVYSPFRIGDLFAGIFGRDLRPRAGFELVDAAVPDLVLHQSGPRVESAFATTREITVAGRPWVARFFAMPSLLESSNAELVPLVLWTGVGFSLVIAGLVAGQTRARRRLERSEAGLQEATARVRELLASERVARNEAERASRLKDEFLAMLSHELRTPLNAIFGWAHLLTSTEMSEEKQQKALATILRNARMQLQLVGDLLDMSRIASGREQLDVSDVDLIEVVDGSVGALRPEADAKGVGIHLALDGKACPIRGDAKRLQQVFWNLLANALKFTPSGGRIDVVQARRDGEAVVEVRDTGVGIPLDFLPQVFDRFRQVDGSAAREHGGLGLGLSIVKSLVTMHGGTVTAASDGPNRGAVFTVRLPLGAIASASPSVKAAAPAGPLAPDVLAGARILIVEDQDDAREIARNALAFYGAVPVAAASAVEALHLLDEQGAAIDLVVSDIGMPQVDGYELLRRIRTRPAQAGGQVPAIALTAYAAPADRARVLAAGYAAHLPKPVVPHELVAACAAHLRRQTDVRRASAPDAAPAPAAQRP